jgi:hypothetical protein
MKSETRNPKADLLKTAALVALTAIITGGIARGQSNRVPGPADYPKFSAFITDRNIFDPNRQPHSWSPNHPTTHPKHTSAPAIQFVGTMSYEKGLFAFLSGNNSDLSKVLQAGDQYLGFTVASVTPANVVLESTNKTQIALGIGGGLKQENGNWVKSDSYDSSAPASEAAAGSSGSDSSSAEPAAPPSTGEPNDVLKRLMQQREKENQ